MSTFCLLESSDLFSNGTMIRFGCDSGVMCVAVAQWARFGCESAVTCVAMTQWARFGCDNAVTCVAMAE
jgi:hypothetical protein